MSIIDGIGDEVTQFFVALLCGLVLMVAWWSTAHRPRPLRAVLIVERARHVYRLLPHRFARHGRFQFPVELTPRNSTDSVEQNDSDEASEDDAASEASIIRQDTVESIIQDEQYQEVAPPGHLSAEASAESQEVPDVPQSSCPETSSRDMEMSNIVNAMDSDASILRNRRIAFFKSTDNTTDSNSSEIQTSSETQKKTPEVSQNVDDTIDDSTQRIDNEPTYVKDESPAVDQNDDADSIRIRLKYLNDDLKEVEGSLHEQLGEFKRRHFRGELSACKLVRLIFNGQVLQGEAATLASCGLFDNCVVHCLVQQPRTPLQFVQAQQQLNPTLSTDPSSGAGAVPLPEGLEAAAGGAEERDWDLGNILLTILASVLSIAWYCHIRFSSQFGVATSLAMLGLTAIYLLAVMCVYFPESNSTPQVATSPPAPAEPAEPTAVN